MVLLANRLALGLYVEGVADLRLVAGRDVFDVTSFLPRHPAGTRSIVRKAGGADCTEDLGFHSAKAQKLWMQHKIGRLEPCGAEKNPENGCAVA